ncbi:rod shape-determining protein MreC [Gracilibacillus boraciitolerans JCM 21714]|uniref:Cell shape-determining protein MreC n=1 Tax=Gracilibacillus boraciitolerans JCM 21714 TaxID=1298598 RepID=W4VGT1_9BACI|nr:rod shape-determining protein MreC [Gracilibacillus boraciitolerans]GAE92615.1 rod shape-determining protein MreC [Gracilibacillus boraciitolerans JCM 21714]
MFYKKKRLFIFLISLILIVGLIGFSLQKRTNLTVLEDFIHDTVGWVQEVVNKPIAFTTSFANNVKEIRNVYRENQKLKSSLEELRQLEYQNQELTKEITELQETLNKTESDFLQNFNSIQASVIAKSKDQWFNLVTINKGSQNGIAPNMAVITGQGGMIGKVQTSSPFTSTVLLLNGFDQSNRISVNVDVAETETDISGFIVGYDEESEHLLLELNETYQELAEGQSVFSSGLGGVFPKGLEIGEIVKVEADKYELTSIAYVKPSADLEHFNHVIVIDRNMATMEGQAEEDAS